MAEFTDALDFIKMEIDEEADDIIKFLENSQAYTFSKEDDPLLALKPVVYTTKLDEMKTVKQNLTNITAKEILKKLHSESKPTCFRLVTKNNTNDIERIKSYIKLAEVISAINYKASQHKTTLKSFTDLKQTIQEINKTSYVDTKKNNKCKPCSIVLKDLKYYKGMEHLLKTNQTIKLQRSSTTILKKNNYRTVDKNITGDDLKVKEEMMNEIDLVCVNERDSNVTNVRIPFIWESLPSTSQNTPKQPVLDSSIPVSEGTGADSRSVSQTHNSGDNSAIETFENTNIVAERTSSDEKKTRKRKRMRIVYDDDDDNDEEDSVPLEKIRKQSTAVKHVASSPVVAKVSNSSSVSTQEKFALIVLTHENKEGIIYRVNATRLVTDYFVTKEFDEYSLAGKYPREEKIIEEFCCWYRREEIISKICSRKNYPFTIQKFLKLPHRCNDGDCNCCCRITSNKNNSHNKQSHRRAAMNKALAAAETWLRVLLGKNTLSADGLVRKSLNYTPKTQNDTPIENQSETYLVNSLLCIKNVNAYNGNCYFELYDIGTKGDVNSSLRLGNIRKVEEIRRKFKSILDGTRDIKDAEICCWYKREKLIRELKTMKTSPAALKHIKKAHRCVGKNCICCCRPKTAILKAVQTLPTSFNHTSPYEKNVQTLCISFSAKAKHPIASKKIYTLEKTHKLTKITDASPAAVVLSSCALKDDNPSLSVSILSKFKTLELGVNKDGQLEAILGSPANSLSVAELRILSDIMAFSAKQTINLGLNAEEFCNRINSKSSEWRSLPVPDKPLIRTAGVIPLQDDCKDVVEVISDDVINVIGADNIDIDGVDYVPPNETVAQTNTTNKSNSCKVMISSEPAKKTKPSINTGVTIATSATNLFSSLSRLMESKNKNYIGSFKSFFKSSGDPVVQIFDNTQTETHMPIIKETFTLAQSETEVFSGPSGLSKVRLEPRSQLSNASTTVETAGTSKQIPENGTESQLVNKLRIKPVSELIARPEPFINNTIPQQMSRWPAPIILKREPLTKIQTMLASPVTILPNSEQNTVMVANIVPIGSQFQLISNPVKQNGNPNGGMRYLTLMPLQGPLTVDKSKINAISQTQPSVTTSKDGNVVNKQSSAVKNKQAFKIVKRNQIIKR